MSSLPSAGSEFPARPSRVSHVAVVIGQRLSLLAIFLVLWWLAAQRVPAFILPGIDKTWHALLDLIASGTFGQDLGITLTNSMLGSPSLAIYALIIVNVWQWTGFSMLMYIAGIANLPEEILEAARVDGARGLKLAQSVVVPMLTPVTKSLLLLGIIGTLQTFPIVQLMTGGGPDHASEVFGTDIFRQSFVLGDTNVGATLSVVVLVIAFVLTILQVMFLGTRLSGNPKPSR